MTGNGTDSFPGSVLGGYEGTALLVDHDGLRASSPRAFYYADLVKAGQMDSVLDLAGRTLKSGSLETVNVMVHRNDDRITLTMTGVPHRDSGHVLILIEDRTFETNMRNTLIESRQRYKDLVDVSGNFAFEINDGGSFSFVSPAGGLGRAASDFLGRRPSDFAVSGDSRERQGIDRLFQGLSNDPNNEVWVRRADNKLTCVAVFSRPIRDEHGVWTGSRGVCREVTEERHRQDQLVAARQREQLFNRIVAAIRDEVEPASMLTAAAGAMVTATASVGCQVLRQPAAKEGVTPKLEVVAHYGGTPPDGMREISEANLADKIEEYHLEEFTALLIPTSYRQMVNGQVVLWRDPEAGQLSEADRALLGSVTQSLGIIVDQINTQDKIVRMARTDRLTGLLNRRAFFEEDLPRRVQRLHFAGGFASMLHVDLTNLKSVNDIRGHRIGDAALLRMRDLLLKYSRPSDSVARVDGDEFVMWMDGLNADQAVNRAETLLNHASEELKPFSADAEMPLGVSVGVAHFNPADGESLEDFIARADKALIYSKRSSAEGITVAPPPVREAANTGS